MIKKMLLCWMLMGSFNFVSGMETQQEKQLRENRTREKLLEKIAKVLERMSQKNKDEQSPEQKNPESK